MDVKSLYQPFAKALLAAERVIIIPHKNPDGDSIGSSLGFFHLLTNLGKQVHVIMPNRYPLGFEWLPGAEFCIDFEKEEERSIGLIQACDLVLMLDFNTIKRLEKLADTISNSTALKLNVDHHPYPDKIADIQISNISVSSTCELSYDVIRTTDLVQGCTIKSAECFYTGIMTDTAALNHNSSRMETYVIVGELLNYGLDKDRIHRLIFHSNSIERFKLLGYIYQEKLEIVEQCEAAIVALSLDDLAKFNYLDGDTEGFASIPLSIKDVNLSVFILEKKDRVKISFRSRGNVAVNSFADRLFGGGGHKNAAGAESRLSFSEVCSLIKIELPKDFLVNKPLL